MTTKSEAQSEGEIERENPLDGRQIQDHIYPKAEQFGTVVIFHDLERAFINKMVG